MLVLFPQPVMRRQMKIWVWARKWFLLRMPTVIIRHVLWRNIRVCRKWSRCKFRRKPLAAVVLLGCTAPRFNGGKGHVIETVTRVLPSFAFSPRTVWCPTVLVLFEAPNIVREYSAMKSAVDICGTRNERLVAHPLIVMTLLWPIAQNSTIVCTWDSIFSDLVQGLHGACSCTKQTYLTGLGAEGPL